MYTILALSLNAEALPFPSSLFSSVAVFNKDSKLSRNVYTPISLLQDPVRARTTRMQGHSVICLIIEVVFGIIPFARSLVLIGRVIPFGRFKLGI